MEERQLPADVMRKIFSFFSIPALHTLKLVSTRWRDLVKTIPPASFPTFKTMRQLEVAGQAWPCLKRACLNLTPSLPLGAKLMDGLASMPRLTDLIFGGSLPPEVRYGCLRHFRTSLGQFSGFIMLI